MSKKSIAAIILIIILVAVYVVYTKVISIQIPDTDTSTSTPKETTTPMMDITVYVQDTDKAQVADCGITKAVTRQVPQTVAVADAALTLLFSDELSKYATYDSVSIENNVAKVKLASETTPAGYPISSLSSCQKQHLFGVLQDTLIQYDSIKTIKIYTPGGELNF